MRQNIPKKTWQYQLLRLGNWGFILLLIFAIGRIFIPPSTEVLRVPSPDGTRIVRLKKIYHTSQPSYRLDYRVKGKKRWERLASLGTYTNAPKNERTERIYWGDDSRCLLFRINNKTVWATTFPALSD